MFGLLRGASCGLPKEGKRDWWQHICGVCLALHRNVGHVGRLTTNYDSALLSLLYSQQAVEPSPTKMGVCLLRSEVRTHTISPDSLGAQFGGAMALIMGSIKLKDQLADGDIGRWSTMRLPAQAAASRWEYQGRRLAEKLNFDAAPLFDLAHSQLAIETQSGLAFSAYAKPTEQAVGLAFEHTATLAGQSGNRSLLRHIGEAYGRLMYLLDSYKDFTDDIDYGKFNPLAETHDESTYQDGARQLWRRTHQNLNQAILELNGGAPLLSGTLLSKQLNRLGERAMQMPHVCAHCFSYDLHDAQSEEEEEELKKKNNQAGCDCGGFYCGGDGCCHGCCDCCCDNNDGDGCCDCDGGGCCSCGDCCSCDGCSCDCG